MDVTVTYTGQLRTAVGLTSETITLAEGATVSQAVTEVAERNGEAAKRALLRADGSPHRTLVIILGNSQVPPGADPEMSDGDIVTILLPISGG